MSSADVKIRLLDQDEWQVYRGVRLAALEDAPDAFVARLEDEASQGEEFWRERMARAIRIIAERGNEPVGLVGLGLHDDGDPETAEVFGLWTAPAVRGERVARSLGVDRSPEGDRGRLQAPVLLGGLRQRICGRLREQLRLPSHVQAPTHSGRRRKGPGGSGRGRYGAASRSRSHSAGQLPG